MNDRTKLQVTIGEGEHLYEWVENWASIPDTKSGRANGRTHGVAVTADGSVVVFHQANPAILLFDREGHLRRAWGDSYPGAHGLALVNEGGAEFLWLTDESTGEVVKTSLDGRAALKLDRPDLPAYRDGKYSPTWVAVNEERFGGNGDVWVADGYGMHFVHRYDRRGAYLGSINGAEGSAGRFDCPHGLYIDRRKTEAELYIADRGNRRFQVYDVRGNFRRAFGSDFLSCPCACISDGDYLLVPELNAKLAVLDRDDRWVCSLGENQAACSLPGWPDHPRRMLIPGKFNSPHAIAADVTGDLYVVEWIIGGRITKLRKKKSTFEGNRTGHPS